MTEISIRTEGRAGRITLTRAEALNALSHDMCREIEKALDEWRDDKDVALIIMDAEGDRAFCAGGDIGEVYRAAKEGRVDETAEFWSEEYRMNAKLAEYPKPIISLMQGFVMGGGVGIGCHGSHRVVEEKSQFAMPECGIGLVPDVGGSFLLAEAPGFLGDYLGLTGERMNAGDAIYCGFADYFVPRETWPALIDALCKTGEASLVAAMASAAPVSPLAHLQGEIDEVFNGAQFADVANMVEGSTSDALARARAAFAKNSPLSMRCTFELIRRVRTEPNIRFALEMEHRFTTRSVTTADIVEGVRAQIIDKDRNPQWKHKNWRDVSDDEVAVFYAPQNNPKLEF